AFDETRSQQRMARVGLSFRERANAVKLRRRTPPQALHLRKDEPYPVAALFSRAQLLQNLRKNICLRLHKAFEVEGVFHPGYLPRTVLCYFALQQSAAPGQSARQQPAEQRNAQRHRHPANLFDRTNKSRRKLRQSERERAQGRHIDRRQPQTKNFEYAPSEAPPGEQNSG